jgi:dethiobiotin synthetase
MAGGLFITGTGTGVGKTYVAALIARALRRAGRRVGVYKPVASGCETRGGQLASPDAVALWEAAGRPGTLEQVCPQLFAAPLAPPLAARAAGQLVDVRRLRDGIQPWRESSDVVLVEGAGGLMSPVSDDDYNADLAKDFGFPLVVVTANALGTINATLQTLITAGTYGNGLPVAGIVLNMPFRPAGDVSLDSNARELVRRCAAPLLADVEFGGDLETDVDWCSFACKHER